MGLTFIDTEVTIAGEALNTFSAADRFTRSTAWSPAVIRWGGTDSLDPATPATLSLRVTIPDGQRVPTWNDRITVTTTYPGTLAVYSVFAGRIDALSRRPSELHDERTGAATPVTEVDISASDELAALGRIKLSDVPWPVESVDQRWQRLHDLLAPRGITLADSAGANEPVRARDVDSYSALEAVTRITAHMAAVLISEDGVIYPGEYSSVRQLLIDAENIAWIDLGNAIPLPADALVDDDRTLDVGGLLSAVTINHPEADPDDPSGYTDRRIGIRSRSTEDTYGPGTMTMDTDLIGNLTAATDRAHRILTARSEPQWRIPNLSVLIDRVPPRDLVPLVSERNRNRTIVRITGGPADLDPYHRVIGGTLTLHGDPAQQAVELTTEPAAYAGPDSLIIADLTQFPISSLVNVTIADFGTISDALRIN